MENKKVSEKDLMDSALLNAQETLGTWLNRSAPKRIQKLFENYTVLTILHAVADYSGYTPSGHELAATATEEINSAIATGIA